MKKAVTKDSHFTKDLGLDSLDVVEVCFTRSCFRCSPTYVYSLFVAKVVMALELEFRIEMHVTDAEQIQSVADAVDYFTRHPLAHGEGH